MKLWCKHWVTLSKRPFISFRKDEESNLMLVSIEKDGIGEREIPIHSKPLLRHYMSNIFIYLMPSDAEENPDKRLVHGWEVKLGFPVEEAKELVTELTETIELCEERREERHKISDREEAEKD